MLTLGTTFPDFTVKSTVGEIKIPDYFGTSWGLICTHPADFTPVCTTEFARTIKILPEFEKRNVKIVGISCDTIENHKVWAADIQCLARSNESDKSGKCELPFPIIADTDRKMVTELGMLDNLARTAAGIPLPARAVYFLDPKKIVRASILYPASSGRNFDEIIRLLDSLQTNAKTGLVTPVDWKVGDALIIPPTMSTEDAKKKFKGEIKVCPLPSGKEYMRYTNIEEGI
uniref:Peroxiredoxin-6 n=1 Tax=Dugesia japonica TaxID=6161 RepID=M9NVF0_DUGJA|nr:peroxiredoxin-6 [Dugesia japonica]